MSQTPPNADDELRAKIETLVAKLERTSVEFMGYQEGAISQEPEPYDVQECASDILALTAKASLHRAIEELEQLLLLIGHSALTRRNIHDRITALQAELQQAEKEQ